MALRFALYALECRLDMTPRELAHSLLSDCGWTCNPRAHLYLCSAPRAAVPR